MADWSSKVVRVPKGTEVSASAGWSRWGTVTNNYDDMLVADLLTNGIHASGEQVRYHQTVWITGSYDFVKEYGNNGTCAVFTKSGKVLFVIGTYGSYFNYSMGENASTQSTIIMNGVTTTLTMDTDSVKANELWNIDGEFINYVESVINLYEPDNDFLKYVPNVKQIQHGNAAAWLFPWPNSAEVYKGGMFYTNCSGTTFGIHSFFTLYKPIPDVISGFLEEPDDENYIRPYIIVSDPTYVLQNDDIILGAQIQGKSGKQLYVYYDKRDNQKYFAERNTYGFWAEPAGVTYRLYSPTNRTQKIEDFASNDTDIMYLADVYLNNYVPVSDFMDLNTLGNSVVSNATYEFVDPKAGIYNQEKDQIRIEWAISGTNISKKLIFDLPANTHAWCLFDGKKLYLYADNNQTLYTWGIYIDDNLVAAADERMQGGLLIVDDIFSDYNTGFAPESASNSYTVKIYTNRIFLRQVYYAFNKDEIPTSEDTWYERWKEGTDSTYVRPDGQPDAGGNIVPIATHILSFNTIAEMKAASDAEHTE